MIHIKLKFIDSRLGMKVNIFYMFHPFQKLLILTFSFDLGNRKNRINAKGRKILHGKPLTQSTKDYEDVKTMRSKISIRKSIIERTIYNFTY